MFQLRCTLDIRSTIDHRNAPGLLSGPADRLGVEAGKRSTIALEKLCTGDQCPFSCGRRRVSDRGDRAEPEFLTHRARRDCLPSCAWLRQPGRPVRGQEPAPQPVEIRQAKHGVRPHQVPRDPSETHFVEIPQPFDYQERMRPLRSDPRPIPILAAGLRIVLGDQRQHRVPGNHGVRLGQEPLAPGDLPLCDPGQRRGRSLVRDDRAPWKRATNNLPSPSDCAKLP